MTCLWAMGCCVRDGHRIEILSTVLPTTVYSTPSLRSSSPRLANRMPLSGNAHSSTSTSGPAFGVSRLSGGGFKTWLRRLSRWPQMDFELAAWQMTYLCIAPRRVYRNVYYHKQTKNTWARDDPAMLLLVSGCLLVAALLWSVFYAHSGIVGVLRTMFSMVVVEFFGVGLIVSTALWALSNRFLIHTTHTHATDQHVEWPYAFDVHANSFFPFFLQLYVAQLLLAPVVTRSNWVCLWVGNTLYLSAFTQYVYVTYLGYNALPFLIRSELLLFPIIIFFALYIVSLLGVNIAKVVLGFMFGV